jgi:4-diphosphocytidyl-2-C-methyl-D-erythritol kinase
MPGGTGAPGASSARIAAQAKVNLSLRVLAREDGGYHQVETLLCRTTLADLVSVRVTAGERSLQCRGEAMPAEGIGEPERNLAWRAAAAYRDAAGFPRGFDIEIEKRIPVGGGLGGGSADAGAVLRVLNALNARPLPAADLLSIAGTLGADVPFLTQDQSPVAIAWGRGDRMVTLPPLPARRVLLFVPEEAVSTTDAYRWIDEQQVRASASAASMDDMSSWSGIGRRAGNDFEGPVTRHRPRLGAIIVALRSAASEGVFGRAELVQLSGSGSTIFVVTEGTEAFSGDSAARVGRGVRLISTKTAAFVEPVVPTH